MQDDNEGSGPIALVDNPHIESYTLELAYKELAEAVQAAERNVMKRILFLAAMVLIVAVGLLYTWYKVQSHHRDIATHQQALGMLVDNQALMSGSIHDLALRQEQIDTNLERLVDLLQEGGFDLSPKESEAQGVDAPGPLRK